MCICRGNPVACLAFVEKNVLNQRSEATYVLRLPYIFDTNFPDRSGHGLPASNQCRQDIQPTPPCKAARDNSIVCVRAFMSLANAHGQFVQRGAYSTNSTNSKMHLASKPYGADRPYRADGSSAGIKSTPINKYPSLVTGAFVTMHGRIAMDQRPRFNASFERGRRFLRPSESCFPMISSNKGWQKSQDGISGWSKRATYPRLGCIAPGLRFVFRSTHFAYGRIQLTDVE